MTCVFFSACVIGLKRITDPHRIDRFLLQVEATWPTEVMAL